MTYGPVLRDHPQQFHKSFDYDSPSSKVKEAAERARRLFHAWREHVGCSMFICQYVRDRVSSAVSHRASMKNTFCPVMGDTWNASDGSRQTVSVRERISERVEAKGWCIHTEFHLVFNSKGRLYEKVYRGAFNFSQLRTACDKCWGNTVKYFDQRTWRTDIFLVIIKWIF